MSFRPCYFSVSRQVGERGRDVSVVKVTRIRVVAQGGQALRPRFDRDRDLVDAWLRALSVSLSL